jgi:arylsulfatase A-like enzyme
LKNNGLLDKTLIVIAGEFGRPAHFDAGGGRGHHGKSFSVVMAGGGLRTGQCVGTTDELAMNIVDEPCGVPDLFATICAAMQVNPNKNLMDGERPVPITDKGVPFAKLFV